LSWPGRSSAFLLALALAAGAVDAATYLGLGRVFTANMTGNTVLLGIGLARGSGSDAARAATALGGFCLGAGAGVWLTRPHGTWPRVVAGAFWFEASALALLIVLWAALGAPSIRFALIVISGMAMGAQSAGVRASDVRGVNTTYMTSTLLNAIARTLLRKRGRAEAREGPSLPGAAWVTYAIGAIGGAFMEKAFGAGAFALPLAIVAVVAVAALRNRREES
jgi:uncharacterized membrane protein YoaK (UPF0700 family)